MEDSISSRASVFKSALVRQAFKMLFFVANISFIIRLGMNDNDVTFTVAPEYVLHEFFFKLHEKQSEKGIFRAHEAGLL